MTSTPEMNNSLAVLTVIPDPPAEFSPFAITRSKPHCERSRGTSVFTTRRPGSPTTSPINKIFTGSKPKTEPLGVKDISAHQLPAIFKLFPRLNNLTVKECHEQTEPDNRARPQNSSGQLRQKCS